MPSQNYGNWNEISKTVFEILLAQILRKLYDQMSYPIKGPKKCEQRKKEIFKIWKVWSETICKGSQHWNENLPRWVVELSPSKIVHPMNKDYKYYIYIFEYVNSLI